MSSLVEQDAPALSALRERGRKAAATLAMPNPRQERPWKYLDVTGLALEAYTPKAADMTVTGGDQPGLSAVAFERAEGALAEVVGKLAGAYVAPEQSKLAAMHYAELSGGLLVFTAPDAEIAEPVRIVRRLEAERAISAPHTLIVTGANSRVSVIEEYHSDEGDHVALPVVEIAPGPGSEVKYTALHRWGGQTQVFCEQRTVTNRDSALTSVSVVTGGKVVKSHIESALEGRGSSSEILGLTLGSDQQHADFYTVQDHIGPDTRSDLLIKSALEGHSRAVYYGLTKVGLGAKNADANQENRNLLLSKTAKADSDPVLEILTNDVIRVSHGATAGPVDEEQLYYLETRGIPRAQAEDLLVWGFLSQVLDRVPSEGLRDELSALLQEKLERAG